MSERQRETNILDSTLLTPIGGNMVVVMVLVPAVLAVDVTLTQHDGEIRVMKQNACGR